MDDLKNKKLKLLPEAEISFKPEIDFNSWFYKNCK